jgi:hypothetical protein
MIIIQITNKAIMEGRIKTAIKLSLVLINELMKRCHYTAI